jgi:adenylate cyclase
VPIFFTNGSHHGLTFATRAPDGFGEQGLRVLRFVMPTIAAMMEIRLINQRLDTVLRIYVGDEPRRAILSGTIRRGQVSRIRSAILFADMRDYTRLTATLSPEEAVQLLNGYFDCLMPPIEAESGEVLKYMGDGPLAIFRERGDDRDGAAQSALTAAVQALAQLEAANSAGRFPTVISAGIALHHGEVAYGNVGSGGRLDFMVIGPDVNLASRIAQLNKVLGEPLLMSQAFLDVLPGRPEPLGAHHRWARGSGSNLPSLPGLSGPAVQGRRGDAPYVKRGFRAAIPYTRTPLRAATLHRRACRFAMPILNLLIAAL